MNMLNSVILEGNVKSYAKNDGFIDFVVASSRYSMNENNERIEVITEVPCRVFGNMVSYFEKFTEIGRGVRVVGRLSGSDGKIILICEHLEWKYSPKKKAQESK